jgi:hypothetical protein
VISYYYGLPSVIVMLVMDTAEPEEIDAVLNTISLPTLEPAVTCMMARPLDVQKRP